MNYQFRVNKYPKLYNFIIYNKILVKNTETQSLYWLQKKEKYYIIKKIDD